MTEGDSIDEALANVGDAFLAVIELYEDQGRLLPSSVELLSSQDPLWLDTVVSAP